MKLELVQALSTSATFFLLAGATPLTLEKKDGLDDVQNLINRITGQYPTGQHVLDVGSNVFALRIGSEVSVRIACLFSVEPDFGFVQILPDKFPRIRFRDY